MTLETEAAEAAEEVVILGDDDEAQVEDTAPDKPEGEEPEGKADTKAEEEPELSEVEKLALDMGWSPKDKWRGAPEPWRPAYEFIKPG